MWATNALNLCCYHLWFILAVVLCVGVLLFSFHCLFFFNVYFVSRVLRPPGGGSNISLGADEEKPPVRKNKMASSVFAEPEDPYANRRNNPPGTIHLQISILQFRGKALALFFMDTGGRCLTQLNIPPDHKPESWDISKQFYFFFFRSYFGLTDWLVFVEYDLKGYF